MLILRRKVGETLFIGDDVKITVMDIYEGGVRVAIDAPKSITILRGELLQAADANRDAAEGQKQMAHELMALLDTKKENKKVDKSGEDGKA